MYVSNQFILLSFKFTTLGCCFVVLKLDWSLSPLPVDISEGAGGILIDQNRKELLFLAQKVLEQLPDGYAVGPG